MKDLAKSIEIGLNPKERAGVSNLLDVLLADEFVLYTKTRKFHWNLVGSSFMELHKFLEAQYMALDEIMDSVAERSRKLGSIATATLKEYLANTRLKEFPGKNPESMAMLANLLTDHETIIRCLRADLETTQTKYHDAGTCDFMTGLLQEHEKMAWMLRSYLQ